MASSQSKVRVTFVESGSPTSSSNSLSMSAFDHCDSGPDNKMAAGNSVSSSSSSLQQSSKPVLMKQSSNSSNGSADLPRSPSMPSLVITSRSMNALSQINNNNLNSNNGPVKFNSKQPPSAIGSNKSNGHRLSYSNQLIQSQQYEVIRKRQYRIGLNLFNKSHPERGIDYLIKNGFIDYTHNQGDLDESGELQSSMTFTEHQEALARAVAAFLLNRKGLSKQMIGEYIGNLQSPFNQLVLDEFIKLVDFTGLPVDTALRKYQSTFRFPGEAQKIEKLVDVFSFRYADCNSHNMPKVRSADCDHSHLNREEVFILSFAIIMLNTDLHVPNLKTRMTLGQWIKNLRGVFQGGDLSDEYLTEIYDRVKSNELKTVPDHVTQVLKVQQSLVAGNTKLTSQVPSLCLPHRRLVCYCRLYEVYDISRKDRQGQHQREIFLFNDMLLVTKVYKKNVQTSNGTNMTLYSYRGSYALQGLSIILFKAPHYPYGLRLQRRLDEKVIITFNARNEHDLSRFVDDLKESIEESNQMEYIRIGLRASNAFEMSLGCTSGAKMAAVDHCGKLPAGNGGMPQSPDIGGMLSVPGNGSMTKSNSLRDLSNNTDKCSLSSETNGSEVSPLMTKSCTMNALNNRNSTCSTLSTGSDKSLAHMTSNSYVTSSLLSTCSSSSSASSTSSSSTTTSASIAYQHDNDSGLSLTRDYSASSNCQVTTGDNGADSLSSGHDSIDNASTTSSSSRHVSLIGQRESCT